MDDKTSGRIPLMRYTGEPFPVRKVFHPTWVIELWSSINAIGWAVAYAASGRPLAVSSPNNFMVLERVAPGGVWATYCLIVGIAQLTVVLLDLRSARWVCAIIMSWFPCTAFISMLFADQIIPHCAVYGTWAAMNLYVMVRPLRLIR